VSIVRLYHVLFTRVPRTRRLLDRASQDIHFQRRSVTLPNIAIDCRVCCIAAAFPIHVYILISYSVSPPPSFPLVYKNRLFYTTFKTNTVHSFVLSQRYYSFSKSHGSRPASQPYCTLHGSPSRVHDLTGKSESYSSNPLFIFLI